MIAMKQFHNNESQRLVNDFRRLYIYDDSSAFSSNRTSSKATRISLSGLIWDATVNLSQP